MFEHDTSGSSTRRGNAMNRRNAHHRLPSIAIALLLILSVIGTIRISTAAAATPPGGSAITWGKGDYGQLGDNGTGYRLEPTKLVGLPTLIQISGGNDHTLALQADGHVLAWGHNNKGQLGIGNTTDQFVPV